MFSGGKERDQWHGLGKRKLALKNITRLLTLQVNIKLLPCLFNPFQPSVVFRIETRHLICSANQMSGFYMKWNFQPKWVRKTLYLQKEAVYSCSTDQLFRKCYEIHKETLVMDSFSSKVKGLNGFFTLDFCKFGKAPLGQCYC